MNKLVIAIFIGLSCAMSTLAHQAFTLVSSQKRTVTEADVLAVEKERTAAVKDGSTLTFTQGEIRLLIVSGPEDDMLSYRVLGVRNPTIIVPAGATLRILFVNRDGDMRHDVRFGHVMDEFPIAPDLAETVGTDRLGAHDDERSPMQAQEIVIKAGEDGSYKYFCSVRGHAKGGMWGNILVGVTPGASIQMPEKQMHVHSADEDKMGGMDMSKPAMSPTPDPAHQHHTATPSPTPHAHDLPGMPMPEDKKDDMAGMDIISGREHGHMQMSSVSNLGDPMSRENSGTAWAPDSSPMYAKMKMTAGGGMWMFMGTGFLRYTQIGSSRN
ncbi:MAG TPA: sulfocyanin-like copper-binding protein, partial [Pyrinomonadaceae bacterium]|nr:sulfocyanin-like copper-binding protein [Pyrinomonadaceae bacterium]